MIRLIQLLTFLLITQLSVAQNDWTQYVNPFIGTGGHGHTYPGATVPFGMVQLSPDTRLTGWDGCSGYHYSDHVIYGFSHTHLSGTGVSDYGDVLFMPVSGHAFLRNGADNKDKGYASAFKHTNETASPGYYRVLLDDYNIEVALTTTKHCGFHKYAFHDKKPHSVVLDLEHRDMVLESELQIINDSTIAGKRISKAWATEQHIYFYAVFSKPFKNVETNKEKKTNTISGNDIRAAFAFADADEVMMKIGISAVDIAGAKKNLEKEINHWDFEETRNNARKDWNNELSRIEVKGGSEDEKVIFYTALYHSFMNPNLYSDVDGRYRGHDMKIHQLEEGEYFTVFSLWDTFRATHPLFTLVQQHRTQSFLQTMLLQYQQGGRLPVWELAACETDCMIGYHSVSVISDAIVKGIVDQNIEAYLKAMYNSANEDRFGLDAYKSLGYIPSSEEGESVSKTLEYAYDDWCIAQIARNVGDEEGYNRFMQRAQYWKNLYDPQTKFMRAKVQADWFKPFRPEEVNFNYTEANAWQYNFFVPQDVNTMIDWMGGNEPFDEFLTELFTVSSETSGRHQADITGLIGQYAHGNEPSHHMAYLYNYAGKPWKTQHRVREILHTMYHNQPDGLSGNEDCGQMSSWYVLSAMGFYPVTPGSVDYILGAPLFDEVKLNLENGESFVIKASNQSEENQYVKSVEMNGKPLRKAFIKHQDMMNGGSLEFTMSENPVKDWYTEFPVQRITEEQIVPVPYVKKGNNTFVDKASIELGCADNESEIFYTLGESIKKKSFKKYTRAIKLEKTTTIHFYAQKEDKKSATLKTTFHQVPANISIKLDATYANQYAASGDHALIDGLKGGDNFKTGTWQGYQGQDVVATIDLSEKQKVNKLTVGFLQDSKSWIVYPEWVEILVSDDGERFVSIRKITNEVSQKKMGAMVQRFAFDVDKEVRFIKMIAKNPGVLPEWHLGAGGKPWIFTDEMEIE